MVFTFEKLLSCGYFKRESGCRQIGCLESEQHSLMIRLQVSYNQALKTRISGYQMKLRLEICVFDRENGWTIGCVLQFAFYKEKTINNYQYKGSIANIHDKNLGVMCTWYTRKEHSGTFEMQSNDIHEYL